MRNQKLIIVTLALVLGLSALPVPAQQSGGQSGGSPYRVDVASVNPEVRTKLAQGQTVTLTARGGQADVLTATEVQPDADPKNAATFQRVTGTVQETGKQRVLFKTSEGLVVPIDVSSVHGLPYLAANQPATLYYYEQGPRQDIVAVWIEPGTAGQPSTPASQAASPSASTTGSQSLQGRVQTIGVSSLTLQT